MTTFYLVRHGQTDWNKEHRLQGQKDIPMNAEGIRQMNDLADRLRAMNLEADLIISSPLDRARTSAQIIADEIRYEKEIIIDPGFLERDFGLLEGTVWTLEMNLNDPKYQSESVPDLCNRAKEALEKYTFKDDARIMIVSHGAMLTAVRYVLSNGIIGYEDRSCPIIQGNVLCCEKEHGMEPCFYNLFVHE